MGYVPVKSLSSVLLLCLGLQSRNSHTSTMGHLAIIVQLLYNLDGLQFIESSPKAQSPDITRNNHLGCSSQYLFVVDISLWTSLIATCHHRIAACLRVHAPFHKPISLLSTKICMCIRLVLQHRTHIRVAPGREEVASAVCNVAGTNDIGACWGSLKKPRIFKICLQLR